MGIRLMRLAWMWHALFDGTALCRCRTSRAYRHTHDHYAALARAARHG